MAADELKDVEKNLDEIKMRSTVSQRESSMTNQESIAGNEINSSGRYYQTVVEQKIAEKDKAARRNKTVKFVSADMSRERDLAEESGAGDGEEGNLYLSNADDDADYRNTLGIVMSDDGMRSTKKSKKEVKQLSRQQGDNQPCCGGSKCSLF